MEHQAGFDPRQNLGPASPFVFSVVSLSIICRNINNFFFIRKKDWKKQYAVVCVPVMVVFLIRGRFWF